MRAEHGTMIDAIPLTVVLTVPAIWPEYARKRMLEAAEFAGICKDRASAKTVVSLVSEPEAAAIATITTVFSGHPEVKPGDLTTVIDIGGSKHLILVVSNMRPYNGATYANVNFDYNRRHGGKYNHLNITNNLPTSTNTFGYRTSSAILLMRLTRSPSFAKLLKETVSRRQIRVAI